jgi:AraC-like DNA-binding protein
MSALESGVFYINERMMEECDWHVTRLALNFNLDARQSYFIGNREFVVAPDRYLFINEGQSFKTFARSDRSQRMVTLAFKVSLAQEIHHILSHTAEYLLDHPTGTAEAPTLFEKTYRMDDFYYQRVSALIANRKGDNEELKDKLEDVLAHFIRVHYDLQRGVASMKMIRQSTKLEIFRRLNWSMEYLHACYAKPVSVKDLAAQSCMSEFHYKRLFKEVFEVTPYQYLKNLRIQQSKDLLCQGFPVSDVCKMVGWDDTSSFIRLFRTFTGTTPGQFKISR